MPKDPESLLIDVLARRAQLIEYINGLRRDGGDPAQIGIAQRELDAIRQVCDELAKLVGR